jgi:hypothetical protein
MVHDDAPEAAWALSDHEYPSFAALCVVVSSDHVLPRANKRFMWPALTIGADVGMLRLYGEVTPVNEPVPVPLYVAG